MNWSSLSNDVSAPSCPAEAVVVARQRESEAVELAGLLEASAAGDTRAFAEFYNRTSARVYGMAVRVLRDSGYAEETAQEVYLQAWRGAATFDPAKGSAMSWMLTLAHRRAIDRVRSEQSGTARELTYEVRNYSDGFDEVSEEVGKRFEYAAVSNCLDTLTETQRRSVWIAYYGGRTYREVADELGVPLPTAKSRIRDGLIKLRECLGVT